MRFDALPVAVVGFVVTLINGLFARIAGAVGAVTLEDVALWATIIAGVSTFVASTLSGVLSLRRIKREKYDSETRLGP